MGDAVTAIEQLSQIDWRGFLITLAIIICSYFVIKELIEIFFKEIGYTPPWVVRREEHTKAIEELKEQMTKSNELIEKLGKRMEIFEKKTDRLEQHVSTYDENRVHDREQSVEVREELIHNMDETSVELRRELIDSIKSVDNKIDNLQKKIEINERDKKIDLLRSSIISFATNLGNPQFKPSKDHYDSIFKKIKEYEQVLEDNGLENGQTTVSVKIIEHHYEESIENGDFLMVE